MTLNICKHDRVRRACDECDMAEEIATLRADLARVTQERDGARASNGMFRTQLKRAARELDAAERERDEARAALKSRPAVVPEEVRTAWSQVSRYIGHSGAHEDAREAADTVDAWLASLPGGSKEPEGFCACGRRTPECDRSRKACASSEAL